MNWPSPLRQISYLIGLLFIALGGLFSSLSTAATTSLFDRPILDAGVPHNVMLALSVEFPTAISAAYKETETFDSSRTEDYLGYFDPAKCYEYVMVNSTTREGYFNPSGSASSHKCSGAWSGHFLNWATMQGADIFRWVMTGGNRVVDTPMLFSDTTPSVTILERAYASAQGAYRSMNFPDKLLAAHDVSDFTSVSDHGVTRRALRIRNGGMGIKVRVADNLDPAWVDDGCDPARCKDFYVRVKVCSNPTSASATETCQSYLNPTTGAAIYKPIGLMQKYKDNLYFGAFGYTMLYLPDDFDRDFISNREKDGGVLRAPVQSLDAEISETGAFKLDPYNAANYSLAIDNSGVMNYINKFGAKYGLYKYWDPVSELYAEVIKYFKALTPTANYVSGVTNQMRDGFPVYSSWTDPAKDAKFTNAQGQTFPLTCKRNHVIGIGDTNSQYDTNLSGMSGVTMTYGSQSLTVTRVPSDVDSNMGSSFGGTAKGWTDEVGRLQGITGLGSKLVGTGTQNSYLIAGIAYYAHSTDIRPDLADVPRIQTVTTYWMDVLESGFLPNNQFWLATKYGGYKKPLVAGQEGPPGPFNSTSDIWKANGRKYGNYDLPDNYFPVSSPKAMRDGLVDAFKDIASKVGTQAGVSLSSQQLSSTTGGPLTFGGSYDATTWTGRIIASRITGYDSSGNPEMSTLWDASTKLDSDAAGTGWSGTRKVVTLVPRDPTITARDAANLRGTPFRFSNLAAEQKLALSRTSSTPQGDDVDAEHVTNYLRGQRTYETSAPMLRTRTKLLGDIVNSKILYVGKPSAAYADAYNPGYSSFKSSKASRTPIIFVGANDGMLHAFVANDSSDGGREVFGMIPYALYAGPDANAEVSGLQALARTTYAHHYYMDATAEVRDIDFARAAQSSVSSDTAADWRSLLVVGQGKGGRSFVAMDVTDLGLDQSEDAISRKILWEFTHADMGFSFGRPLIAKTRKWGWVVILTGGYNNVTGPNAGKGVLYILNPKTGALLQDPVYTSVGTADSPSGMAQVEGYTQSYADYTLDYVYGGDLFGNVWRFDFMSPTADVARPVKIAELKDASGVAQPVTVAPRIEYSVDDLQRYVFVGTGRLLGSSDLTDRQKQTFYAIRDGSQTRAYGTDSTYQETLPTGVSWPVTRAGGKMNQVTSLLAGVTVDDSKPMGWYYDLTGIGGDAERVVVNLQANDGVVTWAGSIYNGDPCNLGGVGRVYSVNYGNAQSVLYRTTANGTREQIPFADIASALVDITLVRVGSSIRVVGTDATGSSKFYGSTVSDSDEPRVLNWRIIRE